MGEERLTGDSPPIARRSLDSSLTGSLADGAELTPIRRSSTLAEYQKTVGKNKSWLRGEAKLLKLEAMEQRKTSLMPDAVEEAEMAVKLPRAQAKEPLLQKLEGSSRDFHHRLGRTWGLYRIALPFMVKPSTTVLLLYSRRAARIIGTIVASIFALLGAVLLYGSTHVFSMDIPYTVGNSSIEFLLPQPLKAPTFVYSAISNFYQNSKDFVNSQPKYLGRGFQCHGYESAEQFCAIRPNFKPPLWNRQKTFCDLPAATKLSPCGLNALWIAYDEFSINYNDEAATERSLADNCRAGCDAQEKRVSHITTIHNKRVQQEQRQALQFLDNGNKAQPKNLENEKRATEKELKLLKQILILNPTILEKLQSEISNFLSGEGNFAVVLTHRQLIDRLEEIWTGKRLAVLAEKVLSENKTSDRDVEFLLRLLNAIRELIEEETSEPEGLNVGLGNIEEWKGSMTQLALRIQQNTIQNPRRLETRKSQSLSQEIEIKSSASDLLDTYQLRVSYPDESSIILNHQTEGGATPWLAHDDLRWFLWRRPAPTRDFIKLYGRIDQDLKAGFYSLNVLVNDFPDLPPISKSVTLRGNLSLFFGSSQFVVSVLCFVVTFLYSLLWII